MLASYCRKVFGLIIAIGLLSTLCFVASAVDSSTPPSSPKQPTSLTLFDMDQAYNNGDIQPNVASLCSVINTTDSSYGNELVEQSLSDAIGSNYSNAQIHERILYTLNNKIEQ